MIYRNKEQVAVTKHPRFAELKKQFPEIEKGERVYMEVLSSNAQKVETDKGYIERVWPSRAIQLEFKTMEDGEPVVYRWQDKVVDIDDVGRTKFTKQAWMPTKPQTPMFGFNTDLTDPKNDVEKLFLMYFFCPSVENGAACKDKSKAFWRFKNEERDMQAALDNEIRQANLVTFISSSDIDRLSAMYEACYGQPLTAAQMNASALKAQFITQVKTNMGIADKVFEFMNGTSKVAVNDASDIVSDAIAKGVLFQGGDDVIVSTKKGEVTFLEGVSIDDVQTISDYVSKNANKKTQLKAAISNA